MLSFIACFSLWYRICSRTWYCFVCHSSFVSFNLKPFHWLSLSFMTSLLLMDRISFPPLFLFINLFIALTDASLWLDSGYTFQGTITSEWYGALLEYHIWMNTVSPWPLWVILILVIWLRSTIFSLFTFFPSTVDKKQSVGRCFIFIYLFIYLFVVNFVIHWNETAMGLHVFPIPIPPPTSLSTCSL